MESFYIIKNSFERIFRDEKRGLLYYYTGRNKIYVVNTEEGTVAGTFSVSSNARQFLFNEGKELFIVVSCSGVIVVYRANEYAEPYRKFKLKKVDNADHEFVIRNNILYGFADKSGGLRYFIINMITGEIKDEFCARPEGVFGYGHAARGHYKLGKISGEVEGLYDNVLNEQNAREMDELMSLSAAVPDEYLNVYGTHFYCKSRSYEFLFTEKGLLVVPDGAPLPKDYARAVNDRRILRENAIIEYNCKLCYDAANGCIYAHKRYPRQDDDNGKLLYKISAESGKIVQSVKLADNINDFKAADGDYLIISIGDYGLTVFKNGNPSEPHMLIDLKGFGEWHYFDGKIYASALNECALDGKVTRDFIPEYSSEEEYRRVALKYLNGEYETSDVVFQSDYFVIDLSTRETRKFTTDSIYRTFFIDGKEYYVHEKIYNPPELWSQAVERAENAATGLAKTVIPKKYSNLGCDDYFSNDKFELVSFDGGVALLTKDKSAPKSAEPEEREIKYTEKYIVEHGLTKDFLESNDDGEVLYYGYFWALESIERKACAAGVPFGKFLSNSTVTDEEIILYYVGWLDTEINEGGAEQYFYNGDSCEFEALLRALKLIGAAQTEKTVERCVKLRQKYESIAEPSEEATEKYYEKLADEWSDLTEDYIELAIAYIRKIHQ